MVMVPDPQGGEPIESLIKIIHPIGPSLKLLLERLEYTTNRLVEISAHPETDYFSGLAGEVRESNASICRVLFGYEFSDDDEEDSE